MQMLSEKRKSELAGISREGWEREEQSSHLIPWKPPQNWEPIPIPPPTAKRIHLEQTLKAAFPALGEPAMIIHPVRYLVLIIGKGINGHEIRRFGEPFGGTSPQACAVREFIESGLDWVTI
jgi:hypothetical protein